MTPKEIERIKNQMKIIRALEVVESVLEAVNRGHITCDIDHTDIKINSFPISDKWGGHKKFRIAVKNAVVNALEDYAKELQTQLDRL